MKRLRRTAAALAAAGLLVAGLAACTGTDAVDQNAANVYRYVQPTPNGTVIPVDKRKAAGDVNGTLLTGAAYSLRQDAGKPVVLNWFGSWCGPCQTETPAFASYYPQVKATTAFLGIDVKDAKNYGQTFVQDSKVTYPVLFDYPNKSAIQISVQVIGLPFTVIVDKHQKVAAYYVGPVQPADLQNALSRLAGES